MQSESQPGKRGIEERFKWIQRKVDLPTESARRAGGPSRAEEPCRERERPTTSPVRCYRSLGYGGHRRARRRFPDLGTRPWGTPGGVDAALGRNACGRTTRGGSASCAASACINFASHGGQRRKVCATPFRGRSQIIRTAFDRRSLPFLRRGPMICASPLPNVLSPRPWSTQRATRVEVSNAATSACA